ncbi:hypothetical protein DVS28_a2893 [Euzebya pacifica]|uniref:Uncharacterized protein n=1 Tax=Euzebya pacifica TaxID=1608957 RepID=A0A346XZC5_9ACTN|nr:hypothetical protein [Euzebya pacifica]AXV07572.1 hypothetical protein DVS28_a2893 [Euzebya pacifica]
MMFDEQELRRVLVNGKLERWTLRNDGTERQVSIECEDLEFVATTAEDLIDVVTVDGIAPGDITLDWSALIHRGHEGAEASVTIELRYWRPVTDTERQQLEASTEEALVEYDRQLRMRRAEEMRARADAIARGHG